MSSVIVSTNSPGWVPLGNPYFVLDIRQGPRPRQISLKPAKALGLTIPQSVLLRADEVIQ